VSLWFVYDTEYPDEGSLIVETRDEYRARIIGATALGIALQDKEHVRVQLCDPHALLAQIKEKDRLLVEQRESLNLEAALLRQVVTRLKDAWGERGEEHQVLIDKGDDQWPQRSRGLEVAILECVATLESTTIGQPSLNLLERHLRTLEVNAELILKNANLQSGQEALSQTVATLRQLLKVTEEEDSNKLDALMYAAKSLSSTGIVQEPGEGFVQYCARIAVEMEKLQKVNPFLAHRARYMRAIQKEIRGAVLKGEPDGQ
jgi:hypothetical protein